MIRLVALAVCGLLCFASVQCTKDPAAEKVLNVYVWSNYLPQSVLDDFKAKTGVTVNVTNFRSNEELLEKLQSGSADYDVVVPSDYMVHRLIAKGLVRRMDTAKLGGLANFDPAFLNQSFDPGNQYSIPYAWGTTGIGYDKTKTDGPVQSWDALFDPKYAKKLTMLDDARECFAVVLLRSGRGVNETDPKVLEEAAHVLAAQKPLVLKYDSSTFQDLLSSGHVALAHGYNGQIAKAIAAKPDAVAFVIPREGGTLWTDNLCVPTAARHTASVDAFLRYIVQPEVAAKIAEAVGYGTPNAAARKLLKPEVQNNPILYPPEDVLRRCQFMEDVGDAAKFISQRFQEIEK